MSTRRRPSVKGKTRPELRLDYLLSSLFLLWGQQLTKDLTSLDYLFQLAVEMKKLGIPWISDITPVGPQR